MHPLVLESVHRRAGAKLATVDGRLRVESYGDPGAGAVAARELAGLLDLSHHAKLFVEGPDRQTWIQGMITADVAKLVPGQGCAAAVLTNKGKLVADVRLYIRPSELWLWAEPSRRQPLLEHLSHFIIMEECELRDGSDAEVVFGLAGPAALRLAQKVFPSLGRLADHCQTDLSFRDTPVIAVGWPDLGLPGVTFWSPPEMAEQLWEALRATGAVPLGVDAAEVLRVEAGRPRDGAELDADVIPLEAGLESSISSSKGCYLGQEVIARVSHRGHVNRKLVGLTLAGAAPALPAALHQGESAAAGANVGIKVIGELRSAVRSPTLDKVIGLGYVRRELTAPGTLVLLPDDTRATVTALPFL